MQVFFKTRKEQRASSIKGQRIDNGPSANGGQRWAIKVSKQGTVNSVAFAAKAARLKRLNERKWRYKNQ